MGKSRLQMRREVEAAETQDESVAEITKAKPKKKAAKRKAAVRRTREKPPERKRVTWVLYSGSMKEEGRFSYDPELDEAPVRVDPDAEKPADGEDALDVDVEADFADDDDDDDAAEPADDDDDE